MRIFFRNETLGETERDSLLQRPFFMCFACVLLSFGVWPHMRVYLFKVTHGRGAVLFTSTEWEDSNGSRLLQPCAVWNNSRLPFFLQVHKEEDREDRRRKKGDKRKKKLKTKKLGIFTWGESQDERRSSSVHFFASSTWHLFFFFTYLFFGFFIIFIFVLASSGFLSKKSVETFIWTVDYSRLVW